MKFYLMAGGLLLTAASVYGVADYLKTKNKKGFRELYKEAPHKTTTNVNVSAIKEEDYSRGKLETATPAPVTTPKAVAVKPVQLKTIKKKKTKTASYASAEVQPEIVPVVIEPGDAPAPKPEFTIAAAPKEKKAVRKKVSMKMFSRAAPREIIVADSTIMKKRN